MDITHFVTHPNGADEPKTSIMLRKPAAKDGLAVNELVERCKPLDPNSVYCNLLQCHHFADTCRLAEADGELVGFVSGYQLPSDPSTLFIWQVAIDATQRGKGLGARLINEILDVGGYQYLQTTITKSNRSSWRLFESVSQAFNGNMTSGVLFDKHDHFSGRHDSEYLVTIQFPDTTGPTTHKES